MSYYKDVQCARCGRPMQKFFYDACPHCQEDGVNINYNTVYDLTDAKLPMKETDQPGIYRFRDFFAIEPDETVISIGEGNTPLYHLKRIGEKLGLSNLYMKDESKNPTMSQKDRMCSIIVTKALLAGAPGVTIASTGNQGASTAAYCAAAGIPCVIFTTPNVSSTMKTFMQVYGAYVFVTPTMLDRGVIMEKLVREMGFIPASGLMSPPIGSSCFGIDGYKTIAFEVYEQLGNQVPEWFIVPISYGDTLYGIYKGMSDLKEMGYISKLPKFVAAEVFGAVESTLSAQSEIPISQPGTPSIQTSIATGFTTYQTVKAVRETNGIARSSHDQEALKMQKLLAQTEGIYAEVSSVASLVVLSKLVEEGKITQDQKVVVLITSTGLKDPDTTNLVLPKVPCIKPTLEDFKAEMKNSYGYTF